MVDIPKDILLESLRENSPFYINEIITKLKPDAEGKDYERLHKRIYNLIKYYYADDWISKSVEEGRKGRPRKIWTYIGDKK